MTSSDCLSVSFVCCCSIEVVATFFFWKFWAVIFNVILVPLFNGLWFEGRGVGVCKKSVKLSGFSAVVCS